MTGSLLIVDDDPVFRALAKAILQRAGFDDITEAGSGREALSTAGHLHPSVVLLDVQLPDLDGFAVAYEILRNQSATTVILCSARDAAEFAQCAMATGAAGFMPKAEFSADAVLQLVNR